MKIASKKIILFSLLIIFLSTSCFAIGAGVQTAIMPGQNIFNGDLKGTIRLMRLPLIFGFGVKAGYIVEDNSESGENLENSNSKNNKLYEKHSYDFGISGFSDFRIIDFQIQNTMNFFAEPGISSRLCWNTKYDWSTEIGLRTIVGVDYFLFDGYMEIYAQSGLEHIFFIPLSERSNDLKSFYTINFPFETGIRFHF